MYTKPLPDQEARLHPGEIKPQQLTLRSPLLTALGGQEITLDPGQIATRVVNAIPTKNRLQDYNDGLTSRSSVLCKKNNRLNYTSVHNKSEKKTIFQLVFSPGFDQKMKIRKL